MANRYKNLIYSTAEYTRSYGGFKGVEMNAGDLISSASRLAYSQNMYKDYDGDGADVIESIPGYRCFANYGEVIHAIYYQRALSGNDDHLIIHVGNRLMRHPVSDIHLANSVGVEIARIADTKSFGFEYGRYYYVMDTHDIYRIDANGECKKVGDSGAEAYVPITHVSGKEYEQINLLSRGFKEEYYVADPCVYIRCTEGLKYTVTDQYSKECSVSGIHDGVSGEIYVPAYVNIANEKYRVTAISGYAFSGNKSITAVFVPYGVTSIGRRAFSDCSALTVVSLPDTVKSIGEYAFYGSKLLSDVYLGAGLSEVGGNAFDGTYLVERIYYPLSSDDLSDVEGYEYIKSGEKIFNFKNETVELTIPLNGKVEEIVNVTVNDEMWEDVTYDAEKRNEVLITFPGIADATGVKIVISGILSPTSSDWAADMNCTGECTPYEAITRCTTAEVFDGRIFFSGNPDFPNTVFYTEKSRSEHDGSLYVGRYNYFNDGVGSHKVRSMLAVRDMLAVFKEGDDGSGSIFYHKKEAADTEALGTIYPVAYVHTGICASGGCFSFLDDPVFLSDRGLMALDSANINYQRNVVCRSHNVNHYLLREDLSRISLCEWLGYLVLGVDGRVFLADSRAIFTHPTGSREYEWFYLTDIGAYTNDSEVYRYASEPRGDATVFTQAQGETVDYSEVYSATDENGEIYYYVHEYKDKYHVVKTEERRGGDFYPATVFTSHGRLLFFGTEGGHVCVFNNDMRGIPPKSIMNSDMYDEEEYSINMSNRIHPLFYSFAGHTPLYEMRTALDDCGIPHLTKNTVKKSLVIKAKSYKSDAIFCNVNTDMTNYNTLGTFPAIPSDFDNFDFDAAPWYSSRYCSVTLPEKESRWIEKQLMLSSSTFASPIFIYSISYRYVIKGRIKDNA